MALKIVDKISDETVRKALKNDIKPWRETWYVIHPEANAEFVCQMEETLNAYQRPHDPARPLVFNEANTHRVNRMTNLQEKTHPRKSRSTTGRSKLDGQRASAAV